MSKKCLLGTVLLSMSAWATLGFADQHQHPRHQQQQQQQGEYVTLAEAKEICHKNEHNRQIKQFKTTYVCKQEREFWTHKGNVTFPLPNDSGVVMKAIIKDTHESEWVRVPKSEKPQEGSCPVLEKWLAKAHFTQTIHSCAELDEIDTEEAYCARMLKDTWDSCDREQVIAMETGVFVAPIAGSCEYVDLKIEKRCREGEVLPPSKPHCQQQQQQCQQQQQQCQDSEPADTCQQQQQQCQQQVQQCQVDVGTPVSEFAIGGKVEDYKANIAKKCVKIINVEDGGLLSQMKVNAGDVVSSINGHRVHNIKEFRAQAKAAKAKGYVIVEARRKGTKDFVNSPKVNL